MAAGAMEVGNAQELVLCLYVDRFFVCCLWALACLGVCDDSLLGVHTLCYRCCKSCTTATCCLRRRYWSGRTRRSRTMRRTRCTSRR